jgi:protein TonB
METTNVTLVTMLAPRPVATVTAEPVQVVDTLQAVRETPEAAAVPTTAPVAPSLKTALQPVRGETAESEVPVAPAAADPTPEVLTALAAKPEASMVLPQIGQPVASDSPPTEEQALPADSVVAETAPSAASEMDKIDKIPTPQPRPAAKAKPVEAKRTQEKIEEKPAKKTSKKVAEKAKSADKTRKKAGSGGRNETDARRGVADGRADGQKEVSGSSGRTSAAGNAAVSNYPGKVAARLRRSVRGVSRPARSRASSDVLVSFTVNAGGGLGGVRIARSSGSKELDKAALAIVRRAAPFPPIPPQSGRRNWAFTLPLGLR